MAGKVKSIVMKFADFCPFFSIYRDMPNQRSYMNHDSNLSDITLTRHDPDTSTNSHLDSTKRYDFYTDPFGRSWNFDPREGFEPSSEDHGSNKAISFYTLSFNQKRSFYHFMMSKDVLLSMAYEILELTTDGLSDQAVVKETTRTDGIPPAITERVRDTRPRTVA